MRGTDRPAGILVLMLIACPASGAFGADPSTLGLPDVSVTAPPITLLEKVQSLSRQHARRRG
jgi:hypothetical protein